MTIGGVTTELGDGGRSIAEIAIASELLYALRPEDLLLAMVSVLAGWCFAQKGKRAVPFPPSAPLLPGSGGVGGVT